MQRAGEHILAGAGFPLDQHRAFRRRDPLQMVHHRRQIPIRTDELGAAFEFLPEKGDVVVQPRLERQHFPMPPGIAQGDAKRIVQLFDKTPVCFGEGSRFRDEGNTADHLAPFVPEREQEQRRALGDPEVVEHGDGAEVPSAVVDPSRRNTLPMGLHLRREFFRKGHRVVSWLGAVCRGFRNDAHARLAARADLEVFQVDAIDGKLPAEKLKGRSEGFVDPEVPADPEHHLMKEKARWRHAGILGPVAKYHNANGSASRYFATKWRKAQ